MREADYTSSAWANAPRVCTCGEKDSNDYDENSAEWQYAIEHGYDRSAHKVLYVDFDSTLFEFGPLMDPNSKPVVGAPLAMNRLKNAGYKLVIYSSRLSPNWLALRGQNRDEQIAYMAGRLRAHNIPYDGFSGTKDPAQAYIDDRAIEFTGDNWLEIVDRLVLDQFSAPHVHSFKREGDVSLCECGAQAVHVSSEWAPTARTITVPFTGGWWGTYSNG